MDQMCFVQKAQSIQKLLRKYAYQRRAQPSELILFNQFVEVHAEQLKGQTEMLFMDEGILQSK